MKNYAGIAKRIFSNGRDFDEYNDETGEEKEPRWLPIGTYKINTVLQNIEANTFTDSTGIIVT